MAKLTIKGLLVQDMWSSALKVLHYSKDVADTLERSTYQFMQREFTIDVEVSSLRINPEDKKGITEILEAQELKDLYYRKTEAEVTVVSLQKQIDDKLALTYHSEDELF